MELEYKYVYELDGDESVMIGALVLLQMLYLV